MVELLAPAGNKESALAAINNGADAIYLGLKGFNARSKIDNFDFEELDNIVKLAHLYDVKVYLALNILVSDEEINELLEIVYKSTCKSVDAFIVQDLGLASLIKKVHPGVIIHASTQMAIHNLEGAIIAEKLGISRIVLARETPLSEIIRIKKETGLEIEYFVQGALCVSFSGNCYMSAMLTGESGNRGRCLQLCRLPYKLSLNDKVINKKYYLSTKDICLGARLSELVEAGVDCFKIEGRARRAGYIAITTHIYRKIIDNGTFSADDKNMLKLAFNRGDFSESYLNGNSGIIYPEIQNNIGLEIGKIVSFNKGNRFNIVGISSNHEISKNDVLKFTNNGLETGSICVEDVVLKNNVYYITTTKELNIRDEVHLLVDNSLEEKYLSSQRKVKIIAEFYAEKNKKAILKFIGPHDINITVVSDYVVEESRSDAFNENVAKTQICKTGNDIFEVTSCSANVMDAFMPISVLNEMRRNALLELARKMLVEYNERNNLRKVVKYAFQGEMISKYKPLEFKQKIAIEVTNHEVLTEEIINLVDVIIFRPKLYSQKSFNVLDKFIEKNKIKDKACIFFPPTLNEKDFLVLDKLIENMPYLTIYANNISALYYAFKGREIFSGTQLNVANRHSVRFLELYNVTGMIILPELDLDKAEKINQKVYEDCYVFAYGQMPLMTLSHCPFKEHIGSTCNQCKCNNKLCLTADNGLVYDYSVTKIADCHFSLRNEKPLDYIDKILCFPKINVFFSFSDESSEKILKLIKRIKVV